MDVVELHDVEAGVEKQERVVPIYSGEVAWQRALVTVYVYGREFCELNEILLLGLLTEADVRYRRYEREALLVFSTIVRLERSADKDQEVV